MTPSVEVIMKIADVLEVSIDYLVGKTNLVIDKATLKRLKEINSLTEDKKSIY
jgi:transcriptional regulator with XRE-family HTH domain